MAATKRKSKPAIKARIKSKKKGKKVKVQQNLVGLSLSGAIQHKIYDVLTELGKHEDMRDAIVKAFKQIEGQVKLPINRSLREEFTGPLTDALFKNAGVLQKKLKDGMLFDFVYRSKIARDIILSPDDKPDHVFEPQTTKLFLHLAKGAKHIVIGGAYAGDHAVPGARVISKNGGTVLSVVSRRYG
jgi:hypothetical protein